jgi:hypothetical protein
MAIKRYYATKDNSITNAYKQNFTTRATSSNMGLADVLEVFSIYGQISTSSVEAMRTIAQFDVDSISTDRAAGTIPASGNVSFYLRLYNAPHAYSLPRNYDMQVTALSQSWVEGTGLDLDEFSDSGSSNWANRDASNAWTTAGGHTHSSPVFTQTFGELGTEDLLIDVTSLVEDWLASTKDNHGVLIQLSGNLDSSPTRSYYTKKFFSRSSEFFFKRPAIEARYDSATTDNRGNFYYSSSVQTADENLNTVYLYNYHRGILRNIPDIGTGNIYVSAYSGSTTPTGSALTLVTDGTHVTVASPTVVTGGYVSTGIYSASFATTAAATPLVTLFDVWHSGDLTTQYWTGSISPTVLNLSTANDNLSYVTTITNLKPLYHKGQTERFRVYTRLRNWSPNIYTKAVAKAPPYVIESGSYRIYRIIDELDVVEYGTGSLNHTRMSFDVDGNYFDLDTSLLEAGYAYGIKLSFYNGAVSSYEEQPEVFKFRVE